MRVLCGPASTQIVLANQGNSVQDHKQCSAVFYGRFSETGL